MFRRSTADVEDTYDAVPGESSEKESSTEGLNLDDVVALINVEGNFLFEKITFADVRSALTQTLGSDKGQIGDVILNGDRGAQVDYPLSLPSLPSNSNPCSGMTHSPRNLSSSMNILSALYPIAAGVDDARALRINMLIPETDTVCACGCL